MEQTISEGDRTRVRAAIAAAESTTSGEIFVVVARASDDYRSVPILWATLVALVLPLPLIFLTSIPASLIYLIQLAAFAGVALGFSHPAVRPAIVPAQVKRDSVRALASEQFLAHGLTATEGRTGVLIFVSLMERQAEIIADTGIAAKVGPAVWQEAMDRLVAEIAAGRLADGLTMTVETVAAVLADHFPVGTLNPDEITNDLVLL